ncbi:GNAT family N-acetyltransferase [Enterococcus diestrammenae]|uniref:GNAT family N-acetyltransferase n=1 Tax=Enterococcus diestrammenae TaxID=1155073 RepID=UPI0022E71963|nr:GNAT family N-acetyltransferase [Enterococcus diestrammenae]
MLDFIKSNWCELIEFRPIDRLNYLECIDLTLEESQKGYVAPNVFSLAQAAYESNMIPLGIYYNSKMVGFILYDFDTELKAWSMSRFMVDKAHQGKGIGKAALAKFLSVFFEEHKVDELYTSVEESNSAAMHLYETLGFRRLELFEYDAGEKHFREMQMVLKK